MLNSKFDVNRLEWLDLVFEHRNQSYGAYVLRKNSGNYLKRALLIAAGVFSGAIMISAFTNLNPKQLIDKNVKTLNQDTLVVDMTPIDKPEKPKQKKQAENTENLKSTAVEDIKQIRLIDNIRPVNDAFTDTDLPTIEDVNKSLIGLANTEGEEADKFSNSNNAPSGEGDEGNAIEGTTEPVNLNFLETYPEFPGGMEAWAKFLNKNLNYPLAAQESDVQGRVTVSFVVERNGEITHIQVIRGIGAGCDEEAVRVIKKSPLWKPGFQNGRKVRVSYIMPIVFRMNN